LCFGARVLTLDSLEQNHARDNRVTEYQYRLVRIVEPEDPIFSDIDNPRLGVWQEYARERVAGCASGRITVCNSTVCPMNSPCWPPPFFAKTR
jgi:hypothetical protein